jgi:t-SNARE complex subunit (syntaxin)
MTTEERVTLLEGPLSTLNRVLSAQELHNRDVAHNMTILLGIASAQQLDIKAIKEDLPVIKERIGHVESQIDMLTQQVDAQFAAVNHRLDALITGSQGKQP